MSTSLDSTLRNLNDCECCEGTSAETPLYVSNRPGLSAIAYRAGTHPMFKESMLARLSSIGLPSLKKLTTRYDDDFSISLIDAFATVADVLTFYQERIANEAYLRTATERRSVLELAQLVDYRLRPGVAANTYLALTVEDAAGALGQALSLGSTAQIAPEPLPPIVVKAGVKVQSVPGPGEQAQMFETVEEIEARPEWNAIKPRLTLKQSLSVSMESVYLDGTTLNFKQGDRVLVVEEGGNKKVRTVLEATVDESAKTTRLDFVPAASPPSPVTQTYAAGQFSDFLSKQELNQSVVGSILGATWSGADLTAVIGIQGWSDRQFAVSIHSQLSETAATPDAGVFAFRQRAAVFGYNAPLWESLPGNLRYPTVIRIATDGSTTRQTIPAAYPESEKWDKSRTLQADSEPSGDECSIYLDNSYPSIIKGSWIALSRLNAEPEVLMVTDNQETTRTAFTISAKVSRLRVTPCAPLSSFIIRETAVLAQSEQMSLAEIPYEETVKNNSVTLDGPYLGLTPDRKIILTGERDDLPGVMASEVAIIKDVSLEGGFTLLTFENSLTYEYVRKTVSINANVADATHGETVEEVLGGGDATQAFQRFTLRQPPLTYTSASNASGAKTTLEVRVNDVLWREVPSFFEYGPGDRVYVTRTNDEGKTTVIFGDGKTGARLPTGQENIRAKYRKGIGLAGLVRADQLTQLLSRPLGLKAVTNPIPPGDAADPEVLDDARRNATLTIMTLNRVVSLRDYEDFARAYTGIDKALATWTWFGKSRGILLTVAGSKGADVSDELADRLRTAIRDAGDPAVPIEVKSYERRFFLIEAGIIAHSDHLPEKVLYEIERALRDTFSFEARAFGQPVNLSEVMLVIQKTDGVISVDVDKLYRSDFEPKINQRIDAAVPIPGDEGALPAELLILDARPVDLEVLS
jgi:predicted phage baseplate assembly protein